MAVSKLYIKKLTLIDEPNNPQSKVCYGHKEDHFETTFEKMFWEIWEKMNYQLPTNTERCYTFVLSSFMHRYVVKYEKETIKLVGARDLLTMSELDPVKVSVRLSAKMLLFNFIFSLKINGNVPMNTLNLIPLNQFKKFYKCLILFF